MCFGNALFNMGSHIYNTGGALLRYLLGKNLKFKFLEFLVLFLFQISPAINLMY